MSNSVLVFSGEPKFIEGGAFRTDYVVPGGKVPHVQTCYRDIIAKEEEQEDGTVVIYLSPGCCVQKTDSGYAVYECFGESHSPNPIIIFSPDTVLCVDGDHEFEYHHENLPIM
ncbi:MAG: hypothetical protein Q7S36_01485 [Candidatus Liptonbacteria bacterium]|nr:hypothetical protein [Candidatus Liptonbacteria bacterium]